MVSTNAFEIRALETGHEVKTYRCLASFLTFPFVVDLLKR